MNKYQDFYNRQREWTGSRKQEYRKSFFNHARKERRTRTFDLFRGDFAAYEPEEIKPVPKFTFRDTISKLLREKKKNEIAKPRPFVVGTVKHKIHSPPFLHQAFRFKESKKKLITPMPVKSFAPMNYKFKAPKGLKIDFGTPAGDENSVVSPFMLNTVWNKLDNENTRKLDFMHSNITVRSHKKRCLPFDSPTNKVVSTGIILQEKEIGGNTDAKRELWPEESDEGPVFGRLNMYKKRVSQDCLNQESETLKIENLSTGAKMSSESTNNLDIHNSKFSSEYETQEPTSSMETTMMDIEVDNNLSKENINHIVLDNTSNEQSEELEIQSLTNSEKMTFESTKNPDASISRSSYELEIHQPAPSKESTVVDSEAAGKEYSNSSQEIINHSVLNITSSNEQSEAMKIQSLPNSEKMTFESTKNPDASISRSSYELEIHQPAPSTKNIVMDSEVAEKEHSNSSQEIMNHSVLNITSNEQSEAMKIQSSPNNEKMTFESTKNSDASISRSSYEREIHQPTPSREQVENVTEASTELQKSMEYMIDGLNVTYTKYSAVIEEDEENDEFELSLEKSSKEDMEKNNVKSAPIRLNLNSNIMNKLKNSDELKHGSESFDNTPKPSNISLENKKTSIQEIHSPLKNNLQDNYINQTINVISTNLVSQKLPEKYINQSMTNSSSSLVSNQTNSNKNDSLQITLETVEADSKTSTKVNSLEKLDIHPTATSDSMSNNSSVLFEDNVNDVNYVKSGTEANTDDSPCNLSLVTTSNCRITKDENVILKENVYSCSTKSTDNTEISEHIKTSRDSLKCQINIFTPSRVEKETGLAVKTQHLLVPIKAIKTVFNQTPNKIDETHGVPLATSIDMKTTVQQTASNHEIAHTDSGQINSSSGHVPVINLTDSPVEPSRKSIKAERKKSTLDCKSPLLLSITKCDPLLSSSDENVIVDLISDDEDDYTSFVHRVLKKHARISNSPKQSPKNRTPLASIGNISRSNLSSCRTSLSAATNYTNSPTKKTPVLRVESIPTVRISPASEPSDTIKNPSPVKITSNLPVEKFPVLQNTPRKTPRRRNATKEIIIETEVPSPLRVMSLRNRNISVSPSPKKMGTRVKTPTKTPVKRNTVKDIAAEVNEDTGHIRVMNLRSRNISVSPSPKKMTPRRRKKDNRRV